MASANNNQTAMLSQQAAFTQEGISPSLPSVGETTEKMAKAALKAQRKAAKLAAKTEEKLKKTQVKAERKAEKADLKAKRDANKPQPPADPEYSRLEDHLNAWSHALGAALGIAALVVCLVKAASDPTGARIAAALIYGISLIALYSISAAYHFTHAGKAKRVMRIFDHSTIFILIAGCYTPFCLLALNDTPLGMVILILQWAIAAIGIGLNIWNMRAKPVKIISMVLYVIMGWMVVISLKPLIANVDTASLLWLLAGGIAYTAGIAFYAAGSKKRYMHFVWHLFVLAGSVLQFVSILSLF